MSGPAICGITAAELLHMFEEISSNGTEYQFFRSFKDLGSVNLQEWSRSDLKKTLPFLSKHILNPYYTSRILIFFEPCALEIIRYALASDAHFQVKCSMLRIVLKFRPDIFHNFLSFFDNENCPWVFQTEAFNQPKKKKFSDPEVTDIEIVETCWILLKTSVSYFRTKWNWGEFVQKYFTHENPKVRWIACQCIAIILNMNEHNKMKLIHKSSSTEQHYEYLVEYELERQSGKSLALDTLDLGLNPSKSFEPVFSQDFDKLFVNVAGVNLPVYSIQNQKRKGCLVETTSTLNNLCRIAIGISTGRAICIAGPVGSGKTSLISHLAMITGRNETTDLLRVQIGEETDSKLLLGTYQCTDIPGEFVWSPGVLTKALLEGHWLLLEDIGSASSDVAALISSLLEENSISIPGFKDKVQPAPGFHLFMTHRLINNNLGYYRKEVYNTELLERHWVKVNLEPLTKEELTDIIKIKFPVLKTVASRMTSVYLMFSEGNFGSETAKIRPSSRLISTRDLFKWCNRAVAYFNVTSIDSSLKVLQDAIDIFCCNNGDPVSRVELSGKIAAFLGILKPKAEHFCSSYKPNINITPTSCIAGRGVLPRLDSVDISLKSLSEGMKYALTRTSCCLLERVAVCLSLNEPTLLVGETGTGKTTTLQILAKQTGHTLVVINMNQQSDSSDLLGGYKPVDVKNIMLNLREEFEALFRSLFNVKENIKFLENISVCITKRKWSLLLKMMLQSQKAAVKRLTENNQSMLPHWQQLGVKIYKLILQIKNNQSAMAFAFVEGALINAIRNGHWVLLDEINLASAETLQCLSGLLEGSEITLLERGDEKSVPRHPDFRIMAAMNPATDFGKKDLPPGIRNRFTELFVSEHIEENDLILVVNCYLPDFPAEKVKAIVNFYLSVRMQAVQVLSDGLGYRPHYSLRTLCRALLVASENKCGSMARSLYEALCLSFLTQLNAASYKIVRDMIARTVAHESDIKSILKQPIPEPNLKDRFVSFEGYWVAKGKSRIISSPNYIFTARVRRNLCDLARIVSLSSHPILIQGETSVGKTSLIINMAGASGHKVFRINNHQHTDLQEYIGSYCVDADTGGLVFVEGVLAQAMRNGDWVILDELNLAPSEVLEALNRVLDDNRELFIPETSVTIKAHPDFRIFATQNPPGTYGGRKVLSRAFRNRFVELHFDAIPSAELEEILHLRCQMPLAYCKKLVAVMSDLQIRRKGSATFAGKQGFITLRDLFRWGERYRRASSMDHLKFYDWDQHVANEGYLILAGRVRKEEEREIIKNVIETRFKRVIDLDKLFTLNADTSLVTKHILEKIVAPPLPNGFEHLVWTFNLRVLAVLVAKAIEFQEPILLVGETGCGKTTICQLLAAINNQTLYSVNCHQHSESSDFIGGLRPAREKKEKSLKLFEWLDGPLTKAMKEGQLFLADEISLADDSVLERLNSLLEPERMLLISEKGSGEEIEITAKPEFHFIGTMNPGGDFGKKELSPALRNRLTEIWCEGPTNSDDLISIIEHNIRPGIVFGDNEDGNNSGIGMAIVQFIDWFANTDFGKRIPVSVRDVLLWVDFINKTEGPLSANGIDTASAYIYGAYLTFIDGVGAAQTSTDNIRALEHFKNSCLEFLLSQANAAQGDSSVNLLFTPSLVFGNIVNSHDKFGVHPFYIKKAVSMMPKEPTQYQAPTVLLNLLRLMRALHVSSRAVLLEGSPGVGKTSLVLFIAKLTAHKVTRINLSEQTDISDLFGADLPVEGAEAGTFAWRDGPFLSALKKGHWILLDELNLASQSVVEGLNSVLDHRGEIYIPELGRTFKVNAENTKIFACQNPQREGGARKGLPQSFLNRFAKVFFEPFNKTDMENLMMLHFPDCDFDLKQLVEFHSQVSGFKSWSSPGCWEFNLRDLIRWGETLSCNFDPGVAVETLYAARMPAEIDRRVILDMYDGVFGNRYPVTNPISPLLVSPEKITIGDITISRESGEDYYDSFNQKNELLIMRSQLKTLKSLALCVKMGWMVILVGKSGSGKTSLIHALAHLCGKKLNTIPVSSVMDTSDLLGGFEQVDYWRHLDDIGKVVEKIVRSRVEELLLESEVGLEEATRLYGLWHQFLSSGVSLTAGYSLEEAEKRFKQRMEELSTVVADLPDETIKTELTEKITKLKERVTRTGLQGGGVFEWVNSTLIKCLENGEWLLLDNVNLCSGAVLDRLNGLLEHNGVLALGERGEAEHVIKPHPNFHLFLTVNPKHGHISRAMRNRGVEIYLDVPDIKSIHPCDLDSLLFKHGVKYSAHRDAILDIHQKVVDQEIGPEEPGLHHLLEVVSSADKNQKQGFPFYESLEKAFLEVYIKSRNLTSNQRELLENFLKQTLIERKDILINNTITSVDCFWPDFKTPSTFYLQEDSLFGITKQHGALLFAILRNFERMSDVSNWPRLITVRDLVGDHFCHELSVHVNLDYNILELLPYLVSSFFTCATHYDVETRWLWLDGTVKLMKRLKPSLDDHKVYEKMIMVSEIVSTYLLRFNMYQNDLPWDLRHITNIVSETETWTFENKMVVLIYYRIMCKTTNEEATSASNKDWRTMSALEYSRACKKGLIDDWPLKMPLIKNLYSLLMAIDEVMTKGLSSSEEELPDSLCAELIYKVAWRFKLSNAARRRLFLTNDKEPMMPLVNEDTVSLLELHYGWLKKHTLPIINRLMGKYIDEMEDTLSLSQIIKEIDDSLNFAHISLLPVARKFRKSVFLPQPKSCPNQCDFAKTIQRFDSKMGLWNAAKNNLLEKTNFLACSKGQETRRALIQATITIHENRDLSSIPSMVKGIETSVNCQEQYTGGTKEMITVKMWPLLELICLQLNSAIRKVVHTTSKSNTNDSCIIDSAGHWFRFIDSVPPTVAAVIQSISSQMNVPSPKENVELNYFLFDHLNQSIALTSPLTWLNWDKISCLSEDEINIDKKIFYSLHTPLYSLFLSKIFSSCSKKEDSPTFSLKAHKNTKQLFHLIKLLLWRNFPGIFSSTLDSRENELLCIQSNFNSLIQNLKSVVKSKIKDGEDIIGFEDLQLVFGRLKFELKSISKAGGGLLPESQKRPEKMITSCIFALYKIISDTSKNEDPVEKWLACGIGWSYLGYVKLRLFSLLELVDPVKKKAIKMQYMSEEVSELHKLLTGEELTKITIGAPLTWPLKEQHECRIDELNTKYKGFDQSVAVRPAVSLYTEIVKDVGHLVSVLLSHDNFTARLNNLKNLNKSEFTKERKESLLAETKSWLLSVNHYQEKLHNQYYVSYPDIIGPILMALSQMIYGFKLTCSVVEKQMNQLQHRDNRSVDQLLELLIVFPIVDLKTALEVIDVCSGKQIINLFSKIETADDATVSQDNKIRLIKICIRIIKSLSRFNAVDEVKNILFRILEHVVSCWNQIQEQEKLIKAQEESIYINRMKLTEEEEAAREISQLFPSSHNDDFGDLEAPVSLDSELRKRTDKIEDPLKLNSSEIEEICKLHSLIVREQARKHWLSRVPSSEDNFIALLNDRLSVFSTLIDGWYGSCKNQLDRYSIGNYLLAADLQTVDSFSLVKESHHYDFYRDTNISESKLCIPLLHAIQKRVDELLVDWPDHPTLNQISMIIQRVAGFSSSSPLSRFLTGLELLLTKLHNWEENAHAGVSLAQHSASLTNQIISWRKLELSAWKGALHSAYLRCEDKAKKWWFYLFSIVTTFIRVNETDSFNEETENLVKSLQGFMETSSLGEFAVRLDLLFTFHCHSVLLPSSERQRTVSYVLWNLYNFYKLFKNVISKTIQDLAAPIEKKLKDFVKIARWNDINYWSVKSAVEKTHHTLLKHIKEYEKVLNEPARAAMSKISNPTSNMKLNVSSLVPSSFLTSLKMADTYNDLEGREQLLARLSSLLNKSDNICKQTITRCEYSKLLGNFELLIEEVEETGKLISEFDIDTTIEKEKRKSKVKSLLQRKRKAITDLFRLLTQIGLSYRSGLLMFEQNNTAFTSLPPVDIEASLKQIDKRKSDKDWLESWKGCEHYFYTSVARLAMLKVALEKPHKDLGPQFIERIKGFTSHSNTMLHSVKETLCSSSENIYVIRCQIAQLLKLKGNNYGLVNKSFDENKQILKLLIDDLVYCLKQFVVLLDACPEEEVQLTDVDQISTIFPLPPEGSMLNAFKYDTLWESTKAKIHSLITSCLKMQEGISQAEKHSSFVSNLNKVFANADIVINRNEYDFVEECFKKLEDMAMEIEKLQKLFDHRVDGCIIKNPLSSCLDSLIVKIQNALNEGKAIEFPQDKSLCIEDILNTMPDDLRNKLEGFVNKILCIIQNVYKKHVFKNVETQENHKPNGDIEPSTVQEPKGSLETAPLEQPEAESMEDIIVDGHLKEKLVESLIWDTNTLRISEVSGDLTDICSLLLQMEDETVKEAFQGLLFYLVPLLDQLVSLYHYFIVQLTSVFNILGKFSSSLLSMFTEFGRNGYNVPDEMREEIEGEGEQTKGGLGLGEGEGEKDVSDQIESEDQLEDARKPGDYGQDEEKDCKEEEKGIEMSEDFGGKLQDIEKKEEGENDESNDEEEEEPDKEMGDTEKDADTLDKQVWGSDSEEEPEDDEELPKDEKGNKGAEQSEKQLGAAEEEKEAIDEDENEAKKKQDKKKEINEMEEPEMDDDQIDPYHGKQQPSPEVEPLELPDEDMAVDDDEDKGSDGEDEKENPFDIDVMKKKIEEETQQEDETKEEKEKPEESKEEEVEDEEEEFPNPELKKPELDEDEEKEEEEAEDGSKNDENGKVEDEIEEKGNEEATGTDEKPSEQETDKSTSKDGSKDKVKNNEDLDVSMDNDPEESSADGKEDTGAGRAEKDDTNTGGHRGTAGKRKNAGESELEDKKHKPGQSEIDRSLGNVDEPVKKKLKTIDIQKNREENKEEMDTDDNRIEDNVEADLYQHIHEANKAQYDAQTVDAATQEQVEKQMPVIGKEEEQSEIPEEEEDIVDMAEDDELIILEETEEIDSLPLKDKESNEDKRKKEKGEGGGFLEEATIEVEGEYAETSTVPRGYQSTFHTIMSETEKTPLTEQDMQMLRQQLENQFASWNKSPVLEEAAEAWEKICALTSSLAQQLSEELRLVLEPTTASSLKGDFRTGKRINMRKVIPYIASQFRKDKIWLRRTKPSKREYQIILAIDDSSSMADNHSKELAFESLAVVSKALNLLEAGDLAVISFGEDLKIVHPLGEAFTELSGARLMQEFSFSQKRTKVASAVELALGMLCQRGPDSAQLLVIISDGRGVMSEGESVVRNMVRKANHARLFIVFLIIDNPLTKDSILDIRLPTFKGPKVVEIKNYMDAFPFPFYLILRDINSLPSVLSDALRQWFELVTDMQ